EIERAGKAQESRKILQSEAMLQRVRCAEVRRPGSDFEHQRIAATAESDKQNEITGRGGFNRHGEREDRMRGSEIAGRALHLLGGVLDLQAKLRGQRLVGCRNGLRYDRVLD